jgi:hypothetical protein
MLINDPRDIIFFFACFASDRHKRFFSLTLEPLAQWTCIDRRITCIICERCGHECRATMYAEAWPSAHHLVHLRRDTHRYGDIARSGNLRVSSRCTTPLEHLGVYQSFDFPTTLVVLRWIRQIGICDCTTEQMRVLLFGKAWLPSTNTL